jgi:hypothetical protein
VQNYAGLRGAEIMLFEAIARNDRIMERFHISQSLTIDDQRILRPKVRHDLEQDGRLHSETAALNGIHP